MEIDNINNNTYQSIEFVLKDNSIIYIDLKYNDNIKYWFMNLKYNDITIYNTMITYNNNLLEQYENILPFTIEITSKSGFSPMGINCFSDKENSIIIHEKENE